MSPGLLAIALVLDRFIGDPDWLWRRIPHPVVGFGKVIDVLDERADRAGRSPSRALTLGAGLLVVFATLAILVGVAVSSMGAWAWPLEIAIIFVLVAQKSLLEHVHRVRLGLNAGLEDARGAVSMIVGRDVSALDESGISKAAIESLSENLSDGVIAPVFWYVIGGLPGIIFYKAVNTADSMIGHRTPRHEYLGKPAALLDDAMNWIPARLTALAVVAIIATRRGMRAGLRAMRSVRDDARHHRSPNAGWPEAAFAQALGLSLGGPRAYGAEKVDGKVLNAAGRPYAQAGDIDSALTLARHVLIIQFVLVLILLGIGWVD